MSAPLHLPPPANDAALLAMLAGEAERRLGLAANRWPPLALRRRLDELMRAAAHAAESPEAFLRRLAGSPEHAPIALAAADALPNGETYFFRDLEQLEATVLRAVPAVAGVASSPVRLLSAGCATGEEVYSLAMLLQNTFGLLVDRRFQLYGLDVSPRSVEVARAGRYRAQDFRRAEAKEEAWRRHFRRDGDLLEAREPLKACCSFVRANLLQPWTLPAPAAFDVVLCRNVLIHVAPAALAPMLDAVVQLVRPGGVVVLGRTEAGALTHPQLQPLTADGLALFVRRAGGA